MNRSLFLTIVAVVNALFGLAMLIAPARLATFYGMAFDATSLYVARIAGAILLGLAVTQWAAREAPASGLVTGVLVSGLVASGLAVVVEVHGTVEGVVGATAGWSTVILHALFAAGFARLLMARP